MYVNLDFFIEDEFGNEYRVVCEAKCDGQEPDHSCTDSDQDYNGWFEVVDVKYELIEGMDDDSNLFELHFESCSSEFQEIINAEVEKQAGLYA